MMKVWAYAKNAKWIEREGADRNPNLLPAALVKAKLEMDRDAAKAAAAIPASALLSAGQMAEEAERQAREAVARSVSPGSAAAPAAKPQPRQRPQTRDEKTGKLKPLRDIAKFYEQAPAET
jgi:hypothetical protein